MIERLVVFAGFALFEGHIHSINSPLFADRFQQMLPLPIFILPVAVGNLLYVVLLDTVKMLPFTLRIPLAAALKAGFLYTAFYWLLLQLQRQRALSYLLITHDVAVVRAMAHDVLVMKDGAIVECGPVDAVLNQPEHPYTQKLVAAATVTAVPT